MRLVFCCPTFRQAEKRPKEVPLLSERGEEEEELVKRGGEVGRRGVNRE